MALLVAAVALMVYIPCLDNGFVDFDDRGYMTDNETVRNLTWANLKSVWTSLTAHPYYPMVFTIYMIQYALWGDNPMPYHLTSVVLHALNAALVFLLVWRLFRYRTTAVMAGLLVALHPLHVDAIAWVGALKDVISGAFVLLSLHCYLSYLRSQRRGPYVASLVLYVLAMTSKTMSALLPFLLLTIDYQQRRHNRRMELLDKLPFFGVAVILGIVALRAQAVFPTGTEADISFYHPANAWAALGFYLLKLTIPINLSVLYASTHPLWWMVVAIGLSIMFVTTTIWMLMLSRDYGFGLAWFVLLATPILGFIPYPYVVHVAPFGNHYMYLADVGLFVCAGLIVKDILKFMPRAQNRIAVYSLVLVVFMAFGIKTALRCNVWHDPVTLWRDSVRYNQSHNSTLGHARLARAYLQAGDPDEAERQAVLALEREPRNRQAAAVLEDVQEQRQTTDQQSDTEVTPP